MKKSPQDLLDLLSVEAVLLPIMRETKHPIVKGWSKLTFEQARGQHHQRKLTTCQNTGVLLGEASQDLISIDFDTDEALEAFKANNSDILDTLQTKGARGQNLWYIIEGDYPTKTKGLKYANGEAVGEWRAGGGQTVIQGIHPSGIEYQITNKTSPLRINFSHINWGEIISFTSCHVDNVDDIDYTDNIEEYKVGGRGTTSQTFAQRIQSVEEAESELEKEPILKDYYRRYIETKIRRAEGSRNSQMVASVAFLCNAVSDTILLQLLEYFWKLNQDVFNDSLDQHMTETKSQLEAVKETFFSKLSATDKEKYLVFDGCENQQTAFRVCYDLAHKSADQTFFMSMGELGSRIGQESKAGQRIILQLIGVGVIKLLKKGTKRAKGKKGVANTYQWL